jgi:hypothetical protein
LKRGKVRILQNKIWKNMKKKISRTGSRKQKKMTRDIIHLDIADAATVFLTRKIKILPM